MPFQADLSFIDPMLRRRMSQLTKISLKVAHDCVHDLPSVRFVYASRHGELHRTTDMLENLAAGESLSPSAFSLSTLNASAGLFSILRNDTAPATAVTASMESFGYGFLEACLQFAACPWPPVLFVYADQPLPDIYGGCANDETRPCAIAMLLQTGATELIWCKMAYENGPPSTESQLQTFLRCLNPNDPIAKWHGAEVSWTWGREKNDIGS